MTELEIVNQRLHNQKVSRSTFTRPEEVVGWMGAIQAQDYLPSLWAIGLRMKNAVEAEVEQAIIKLETHNRSREGGNSGS